MHHVHNKCISVPFSASDALKKAKLFFCNDGATRLFGDILAVLPADCSIKNTRRYYTIAKFNVIIANVYATSK